MPIIQQNEQRAAAKKIHRLIAEHKLQINNEEKNLPVPSSDNWCGTHFRILLETAIVTRHSSLANELLNLIQQTDTHAVLPIQHYGVFFHHRQHITDEEFLVPPPRHRSNR